MQDILESCMGLDIHRDTIVACLLRGPVDAKPECEVRTFGTLAPEIEKLREWVKSKGCRIVAMESTGIYWQPVYELLEPCFGGEIKLLVVNARHMKNVPGKKTDIRDAECVPGASALNALPQKCDSGHHFPKEPDRQIPAQFRFSPRHVSFGYFRSVRPQYYAVSCGAWFY